MKSLIFQVLRHMNVQKLCLSRYLHKSAGWQQDCVTLSKSFQQFGCSYVHDPRVDYSLNSKIVPIFQRYYAQTSLQAQKESEIGLVKDTNIPSGLHRPYKVKFQDLKDIKASISPQHKSHTPVTAPIDPTIRLRWLLGSPHNVIPSQLPNIAQEITQIGRSQFECALTMAQMLALGMGLQKESISGLIKEGNCIFGPPGHDLSAHAPGDILLSFHYDFTMFTVLHKATFPGLYLWTPGRERFQPKTPQNHYLIMGGRQLQWVTGGFFKATLHEVYYDKALQEAYGRIKEKKQSPWRVSTPLFINSADDKILKPFSRFESAQTRNSYPPLTGKEYYNSELAQYLRK